jgi:hypothetical protein
VANTHTGAESDNAWSNGRPAPPATPPAQTPDRTPTYRTGNNPGTHRPANTAGNAYRSGARGPSAVSATTPINAETVRRVWLAVR